MTRYLAGVDVGTTGARCMIFDLAGRALAGAYREYPSIYPRPGWVEQHWPLLIEKTFEACRAALARAAIDPREIASVGFSSQRSVTCPVDEQGEPVRPMISWQDARTAEQVERMRAAIEDDRYYEISGLPMGTTWVITKLLWMEQHEPELFSRTARFVQNQDLALHAFGADETFTDVCSMAFYGTWDVAKVGWSDELMRCFQVNESMFGRSAPAGTRVGSISRAAAEKSGFAAGTPLCVGAGDQNCGVVGMGAIRPGIATVTLGTCGMAVLSVDRPVTGFGGMMLTNHAVPGLWEIEGLSNAAAASLRWLRDEVACEEKRQAESQGRSVYELLSELAAASPAGAKGLIYLPYLATAATPRWNPQARSALIGMSFAHRRADLVRAVMEGVVLEIRDMMQSWLDAGLQVESLRIGGGATRSALWNQIQADVYGRPVQTLQAEESTGLGAALLGGVGAGLFGSIEEGVEAMVRTGPVIEPDAKRHALYEELYLAYEDAYHGLADGGTFARLAKIQAGA